MFRDGVMPDVNILFFQINAFPLHHHSAFGDFSRSNLHSKKGKVEATA